MSAMPRACFFACARGAPTPARCRASREDGSAREGGAARALRVRNGYETLSASPRTESEAMDSRSVHSSRFRAALILQIRDASSKSQFRHSSEKCTLAGGVHTSRFFAGSRRKRARVARIRPQPPVSCRLRAGGRRPSPPRHLARMTAKRSVAAHLGGSIRKTSSRAHDCKTKPRIAGSPPAGAPNALRTACGQSSDTGLFCLSCRQNVLDSHPLSANAERERTRCSTGVT